MQHSEERTRRYNWQTPPRPVQVQDSGLAYLQAVQRGDIGPSPMDTTISAALVDVEPGYVVYRCEPAEYHYNPIGMVHGGLAASLFASSLSSAVQSQLRPGAQAQISGLHLHYVRALSVQTGPIRCEARALHVGRMMATASGQLIGVEDGKLYGHATSIHVVQPEPDPASDPSHDAGLAETRVIHWDDPMAGAMQGLNMDGLTYLRAIAEGQAAKPPIGALLGMTGISRIEPGQIRFDGKVGGWQLDYHGRVHEGVGATLCDSALGCAVQSLLKQGQGYTTAELNINYVRPVPLDTPLLHAEAVVLHHDERMATAEARLVDEAGTLYAHASTICLIFSMPAF